MSVVCKCADLSEAALSQHIDCMKFYIDSIEDINAYDEEQRFLPLIYRCKTLESMKLLYDAGINMNGIGNFGNNILHHMVFWSNNKELIEFLIDVGVDMNLLNNSKRTPLQYAAGYNLINNVQILIEYGADPQCRALKSGDSLLHYAAIYGSVNYTEYLIRLGLDPCAVNNFGETPLHNAVFYGNINCMKLLIQHGADPCAKTNILHNALQEDEYLRKKYEYNVQNYQKWKLKSIDLAKNGSSCRLMDKNGLLIIKANYNNTECINYIINQIINKNIIPKILCILLINKKLELLSNDIVRHEIIKYVEWFELMQLAKDYNVDYENFANVYYEHKSKS